MKTRLFGLGIVAVFLRIAVSLYSQVPQLINYQGRIVVGVTNFNGSGQFKFALVNAAGTTAYWTNDGTHLNGTEPTAAVSLTVAKGLYSVLLGDTSLANMTAVPASVFNNTDVRLRVWFDDGTTGSQLLTPDQRIATVGYAMMAANIADGTITSAKIAGGAVGSTQLANGAVTSAQIDTTTVQQRVSGSAPAGQFIKSINTDGTIVTGPDANSGGTVTSVASGSGLTGGPITGAGTIAVDGTIPRLSSANTFSNSNYFTGGNVGIGITAPAAKLDIVGTDDAGPQDLLRLSKLNYGSTFFTESYTDASNWGLTLHGSSGPTNAFKFNMVSGRLGIGTASPAASLDVNGNIAIAGAAVIDANRNWVGNPIVPVGPNGTPINPLQVALLKWAPSSGVSFPVGGNPDGVAFDGANIWVADFNSNNVTVLRASDGSLQGSFSVGTNPYGVAFDGANIWVVNVNSNNVTKLRASDGFLQGTFSVGSGPHDVAYDGTNIWVTNITSNNVTKLRASDGALQGTFNAGTSPYGVAFDGTNIWVVNQTSNNVTKLRASDGSLQGTFGVGSSPGGVAFDGANIWVTNAISNNVTKLRASDGALQGTFGVGGSPIAIAFDGANIWVANGATNNVTELRASDGALQGTFTVGAGPGNGVAFDGANIWVTNGGSSTVSKL